jgi:hypothetical protein
VTTLAAGSASTYSGAAFPSPSAGWLLGQPGSDSGRTAIWHTATAGRTWQVQWQGAGSPLGITAAGPAHAWALVACAGQKPSCGRELLATTDGGLRWRVLATLPKAVNQVQFYSPQLGIATSDNCLGDRAATHCPGEVLVSRDGGARWTAVLRSSAPVFATASVTADGGTQLWAAETYPANFNGKAPITSKIKFLASTNGGRSWREQGQLSGFAPFTPEVEMSLAAGSSGLTWASVFDPLSCAMHGCSVVDLLRSGNGGRTWKTTDLPNSNSDDCSSADLVFSAAPDGSAWAATGRNGAACDPPLGLVYRDGPSGWQELPPVQLTQATVLDAVSQDVAYAIDGQDIVTRTDDGGQHWTQLLPAVSPTGQLAVLSASSHAASTASASTASASTALAAQDASDSGAILRSGNGGHSWTRIADLPGVITQLDFPTASYGVAATYQAGSSSPWQLWRSWNGGFSWQLAGGLPRGSMDIYGPWISADGRGLLLTLSGGSPWEPSSGGTAPVRVWITVNWGATWTRGALLPLGAETLTSPAGFVPVDSSSGLAGWSGWLPVSTASYSQRVAVVDSATPKTVRLLPSSVAAGYLQLIGHGTGLTWNLESTAKPTVTTLSLYRTTNNGRSWQHSGTRLVVPAGLYDTPLIDFTDANHGWLTLGNTTWRTTNGGQTWTQS